MNHLKKYWTIIRVIVLVIPLLGISVNYVSAEKPEETPMPFGVVVINEADNPVPVILEI